MNTSKTILILALALCLCTMPVMAGQISDYTNKYVPYDAMTEYKNSLDAQQGILSGHLRCSDNIRTKEIEIRNDNCMGYIHYGKCVQIIS